LWRAFARSGLALLGALFVLAPASAATPASPREQIRLDSGWRFHRGDPPGVEGRLDYDVRPEVTRSADGKVADARPDEAVKVDASRTVLKPWILPTANPFIADPAKRHARPSDTPPGSDVAFLQPGYDDRGWEAVTLPHDWAIAGPFIEQGPYGGMGRLPSWGVGWYRRALDIPADMAGRRVFLDVGGAMSYATVWLNGRLVGGWPYGYNAWRVDLTPYLAFGGDNRLAIRLDNPPESARWYPGGGLYRDVWLTVTDPVHVGQWGTFVTTTDVSAEAATVNLRVDVDNAGEAVAQLKVASEIFALDAAGQPTGEPVARIAPQALQAEAGSSARLQSSVRIDNPRLWGPPPHQEPHRYLAVTTVREGGRTVDRYETRFGIRDVRWDPDRGVVVNGEHIPLRGVNQHHDLGALGAAFNLHAAERQLEILRDMGVNAIRMAHNPPDPQLLELTDRMGFLVIDEVFDSWAKKKTPLDFHLVFPDWHEADLRAMLRRDRNHPSVILWSVGNEVGEQYDGEAGAAIARELVRIVREEDPTRPATASMNWAKADMPFPPAFDVINLNYQGEGIRQEAEFEGTERIRTPPSYPAFREAFPDKVIFGSETASAFSSRGIYLFPVSPRMSAPVRDGHGGDSKLRQVSSYELHAVDFGASADKVFATLDRHPYVAGEFVWNGFDYLGEPTPYYDSRSSYSGMIDLAGFPKDRYFLYQSRWRPDLPMVHILPHWTWPGREGQLTPVHVFTSGDEAELFVNGVSQGRRKKTAAANLAAGRAPGAEDYRLRWDEVVYLPGEVRVQAYRDGKPWASGSVRTAGAPARLELSLDRGHIAADGRDLAFATVRVVDAAGNPVPDASDRIRFSVDGPGRIVATDNGDATDMTPFPSPERDAFSGLALAIVAGQPGAQGTLTLRAESGELQGASATLQVGGQPYVKNPRHWPTPVMDTLPPPLPAFEREHAVLVFSKTNGFRDDAQIQAANAALRARIEARGWDVFVTENAAVFNPVDLARFDVVVLNSTSGDTFLPTQRDAFRHWLEQGGGLVALHGAGGDHHYDWRWYVDTVLGAQFIGHTYSPQFQQGVIEIAQPAHPAMRLLPARWQREEEWYAFDRVPSGHGTRILARLDESSYAPEPKQRMGDHPIVWTRCIGTGRVFYSALGHKAATYAEPLHLQMIDGALGWAAESRMHGCDSGRHG
jgi:beta-galactosidase